MHAPPSFTLLAALALTACSGCDEQTASAGAPDAGAPDAASPPSAGASAKPAPSASASASAEKGELKVLAMVFTSEVKQKEAVDKLDAAKPGQRVWVHLTMRNRTGDTKPIALAFKVNGTQRAKIDLKVDPSWSYRTWGYVTLRDADLGELVAEVRDDSGTVMSSATLPIKGDGPAKPQKK